MKIIEFTPSDHYRVQQFIELPFRIYRQVKQWVPPLAGDMQMVFNQKKNPFFKHSQAAFFLALLEDGSPVGRLAILNNRNYNTFNNTHTAFFCLFECYQDHAAAYNLFNAGFSWTQKQELDFLVGPKGFTALDGLGLLVKGFDHRPAFGITYNPAYYPELLESVGFSTQSDIVSGYLPYDINFPERVHKISKLVQSRRGLKIVNFRNRSELRKMVPKIMETYNESLIGTTGNVPLTADEVNAIANQLIWFANPRLIKIIEKDHRPVGYLFAYPDISAAVQRTGGKIFPFGWIQFLLEMKKTEWVNINGVGILDQFQGLGGTAILFSEMYKSILEGKFKHAEIVQIGVDNDKMQRELKDMGIDFYKTHRMYQRKL